MFKSITATTIDTKGRLTVPTLYRDDIDKLCGGRLMLTAHVDRCLLIYPMPEWERFEAQLLSVPNFQKKVRGLHRFYLGYARPRELDGQSRINIPPELREFADLKKDVFLVGQGNKFELWNDQKWQQETDEFLEEEANSADDDSLLAHIVF